MKRVLVPLDGSEYAEQALKIVNDLALWQQVELILLTVIEDDVVPYPAYIGGLDIHVDVAERARRDGSTKYIKAVAGREQTIVPDIKTIVKDGLPADVIVATAEEEAVDLIIMVTHGYGLFERLLHGSVTERVVRYAHCPVLAIRDSHLPEHFLIALDGTEYSEEMLPSTFELASFFDAKVTLTTVRRPQDMPRRSDFNEVAKVNRRLADNLVAIESGRPAHYLDQIKTEYEKKFDVEIDYDFEVGDPGRAIVNIAKRHGCDLIAMVTHGRKGLDWLTRGSVTEKVMHNTDTAMYILHKEEEDEEE